MALQKTSQPSLARSWGVSLLIAVCTAACTLGIWALVHGRVSAPEHVESIAGLTYNSSGRFAVPEAEKPIAGELITRDLTLLAQHTKRIRIYSALDQAELPKIAGQLGLEVMLGAWIDERLDSNHKEIAAAIKLARTHSNVRRLIVGNETQLKVKVPPNRLITYLDQTRAALRGSGIEISTAEPWHIWLQQPQLAQHVDFIAIHVLPYWAGTSIDSAIQTSLDQIEQVKARFPKHQVVVTEVGWPSNGPRIGPAQASAENQAVFVRSFLEQARAKKLDYFLIEAFDQPWKINTEGRVGAYWGLWDTWGNSKFNLTGPVLADPFWKNKAWAAAFLGIALALPFLLSAHRLKLRARATLSVAAQAIASLGVILISIPLGFYLTVTDVIGLVLAGAAITFISATLLAQTFELVERFSNQRPDSVSKQLETVARQPFISIHLACANEPVAMVTEAVNSLLLLDWPHFEVIVIDNNTADASTREKLAQWMAKRGDSRLRFAQFDTLAGYKAGALNQALKLTHDHAQWIAVVDADYVVDPQWIRTVQNELSDPAIGVVQLPQAHRNWSSRWLERMMNWETEGFFRIGMHHRNAANAIVQHGTMTIIRAQELRRLQWNEQCICEDTELGLRLLKAGWRAVYVDRVLGKGVLPANFAAYARQRKRWALGAMQIFKQHVAALIGPSSLTLAQRYHFLAGWLPWFGDALHLLFTVGMIFFSLGMVYFPDQVEPPLWLFMAPLIAYFCARLLIGPLLYIRCVPCGLIDRLGSAVAGMALSHRVARGILQGLFQRKAVFEITTKSSTPVAEKNATYKGPSFAREIEEELALLAGLIFCVALLVVSRDAGDSGRLGWIAVLIIQSLPYWAVVVCRLVEVRQNGLTKPFSTAGHQ